MRRVSLFQILANNFNIWPIILISRTLERVLGWGWGQGPGPHLKKHCSKPPIAWIVLKYNSATTLVTITCVVCSC